MVDRSASETHLIVLPGGGYAAHVDHEAEPIVEWLEGLGLRAGVFRYPLLARHPEPLDALRLEIRRLREGGVGRIGLVGFSAGGHLAGLAALAPGAARANPRLWGPCANTWTLWGTPRAASAAARR